MPNVELLMCFESAHIVPKLFNILTFCYIVTNRL